MQIDILFYQVDLLFVQNGFSDFQNFQILPFFSKFAHESFKLFLVPMDFGFQIVQVHLHLLFHFNVSSNCGFCFLCLLLQGLVNLRVDVIMFEGRNKVFDYFEVYENMLFNGEGDGLAYIQFECVLLSDFLFVDGSDEGEIERGRKELLHGGYYLDKSESTRFCILLSTLDGDYLGVLRMSWNSSNIFQIFIYN